MHVFALDVTHRQDVLSVVTKAWQIRGHIDVVLNNAGFGLLGAVEEVDEAQARQVFDTNFFGLLSVTQAALPHLRAQASGHILNISSIGGFAGFPGYDLYSASKFAVEGLSEALAAELEPLGIHVTIVEPGYFRTEFLSGNSLQRAKRVLEAYAPTSGKTRQSAEERDGQQPGDPALAAKAIIAVTRAQHPPLRLVLGADAVERVHAKLTQVVEDLEAWKSTSVNTAYPAVAAHRPALRPAAKSGTFALGGDLPVYRLGFGTMQLPGPGVWGEPADRAEAIAVLRRAVELGINLIDTADSYGPEVAERLTAEALYPYPDDLVIATKAGFQRPGAGQWVEDGRPEHLRSACEGSLRRLRLRRIDLFQLHRIDPKVALEDQIDTLLDLQREGKIRYIGLSEVTVEQIEAVRRMTPVISVQNRYNFGGSELRGRAGLLHPRGHWLHSLVPARDRQPCEARRPVGARGGATRRAAGADRDRMAAQEVSRDAPDPGNLQDEAPRGEYRRGPPRTRRFTHGGLGTRIGRILDIYPIGLYRRTQRHSRQGWQEIAEYALS